MALKRRGLMRLIDSGTHTSQRLDMLLANTITNDRMANTPFTQWRGSNSLTKQSRGRMLNDINTSGLKPTGLQTDVNGLLDISIWSYSMSESASEHLWIRFICATLQKCGVYMGDLYICQRVHILRLNESTRVTIVRDDTGSICLRLRGGGKNRQRL